MSRPDPEATGAGPPLRPAGGDTVADLLREIEDVGAPRERLAQALREVSALGRGVAPRLPPALAAALAAARRGQDRRARRRRHLTAGVLTAGLACVGVTAASAADVLPVPAQRIVSRVLDRLTTFHVPERRVPPRPVPAGSPRPSAPVPSADPRDATAAARVPTPAAAGDGSGSVVGAPGADDGRPAATAEPTAGPTSSPDTTTATDTAAPEEPTPGRTHPAGPTGSARPGADPEPTESGAER